MFKDQLSKLFDQLRSEFEQMEPSEDLDKEKLEHLLRQGQHKMDQPGILTMTDTLLSRSRMR